jgi:hypothetical protein
MKDKNGDFEIQSIIHGVCFKPYLGMGFIKLSFFSEDAINGNGVNGQLGLNFSNDE